MLEPSEIQRAEDCVGMAMPTVPLSCAKAGAASAPTSAALARMLLRSFIAVSLLREPGRPHSASPPPDISSGRAGAG